MMELFGGEDKFSWLHRYKRGAKRTNASRWIGMTRENIKEKKKKAEPQRPKPGTKFLL